MAAPHTSLKSANAVRETSTTTGTGTFSLSGAVIGYQTFVAGVGDGAVVPYFIRLRNGSEWEYGIGTVTAGTPDTLARTTVLRGSNGTSAVNFSAGVKDVGIGAHAAHSTVHIAAGPPGIADDNDGSNGTFLPGSIWIDATNGVAYILLDDTNGAAVWRPIGGTRQTMGPESSATISSDAITVSSSVVVVDTEGAAALDDLKTINGTIEGGLLFLRAASGARDILVWSDGSGNITGRTSYKYQLGTNFYTPLLYSPATSKWEIIQTGGAAIVDTPDSGGTVTFDIARTRKHTTTLDGNHTLALSGDKDGEIFIVELVQDGTGSRTVTWWSGINWEAGVAPTLTTTANKSDVFGFIRKGSGDYLGFVMGQNFA